MTYQGIATMYMTMPMTAQTLPIFGSCSVKEKKISLQFPLSGVSFDLPEAPKEDSKEMAFQMSGASGDMNLSIAWKADIKGFVGCAKNAGKTVIGFVFYKDDSPLTVLKQL